MTPQQAVENLNKIKPGMDCVLVEELIHSVDFQRKGYITKVRAEGWGRLLQARGRRCKEEA